MGIFLWAKELGENVDHRKNRVERVKKFLQYRAKPDIVETHFVIANFCILGAIGKRREIMQKCGNLPLTENRGLPQTA